MRSMATKHDGPADNLPPPAGASRRTVGDFGEAVACGYLVAQGYRILERNVRISGAEVDIVALDGRCLVFVEVRLRRSRLYGTAEESITPVKRRRMRRAALFLAASAAERWPFGPFEQWRIDFIGIHLEQRGGYRFNHLLAVA